DPNSPVKCGVIEQRWFGGFTDWAARLNKVQSQSGADLMQQSFHQVLYSASQTCGNDAGTAAFTASLDISVSGSARLHITYGYYMEGTLFPPAVNQAYVYASSDASASLGFEMSGKATASYNSGRVPLIPEISWPGVSAPTASNLHLTYNGVLQGSLSVSGTFTVSNTYTLPGGRIAWGLIGDPSDSEQGLVSSQIQPIPLGWAVTPQYNIQLGGSLDVHIIPEAALTIDVFRGTPAHLGVIGYISADADMGVRLSADLSSANVNVGLSLNFNGGVDTLSGSSRTPILGPFNFFHEQWTLFDYTLDFASAFQQSLDRREWHPRNSTLNQRSLLPGDFSCPTPEDDSSSSECSSELADDSADPDDPDDVSNEAERRDF
ncbi:hypothetical protein C8R46DRAFT_815761, partial [Mycena filopes]